MLPYLFNYSVAKEYTNAADTPLFLTVNQRLANKILDAHAQEQQRDKGPGLKTIKVSSLKQLIDELWQQLQYQNPCYHSHSLLNSEQLALVWHKIVADTGLMQPEKIARQAQAAYQLTRQWQLDRSQLAVEYPEQAQFYQWCDRFEQTLKSGHWLCQEDVVDALIAALKDQTLTRFPTLKLIGFDTLSPQIRTLLDAGSEDWQKITTTGNTDKHTERRSYANPDEELKQLCHWAKTLLQQHSPDSLRIGIILPNLGQRRHEIMDALSASIELQHLMLDSEDYTLPFNISAGVPLGQTPLIADTLRLLGLIQYQHSPEDYASMLFSPFWGKWSTELPARSLLAEKIEQQGQFTLKQSRVRELAQPLSEALYQTLNHIHQQTKSWSQSAPPSEWVTRFLALLDTLGWPGERTPDSHEYQQTQNWYELLERFASLDDLAGNLKATEALQQIITLAGKQPFQPQVPDSPIQVLGMLEGVGLSFTHCWVLGMDEKTWPEALAPNPLLPIKLQRELSMPRANHQAELEYACSVIEHYRHCASEVVFSAPEADRDNNPLLPSQLIRDIPFAQEQLPQADTAYQRLLEQQFSAQSLEAIHCQQGTPLAIPQEKDNPLLIKGGTGVLKAVADNPFDAFARYRLKAKPVDPPVNGLSPLDQGNILHNSLAAFWLEVKTRDRLCELDDDQLQEKVREKTEAVIRQQKKQKQDFQQETLYRLETERQTGLMVQWLETEKKRPPFTVVAIEEAMTIDFEGHQFNIRMDRVDQLEDGSFLLLDYKSGSPDLKHWHGENIIDPQLPLYALVYPGEVSGISFAQINIKDQALIGLHNGEHEIKSSKKMIAIGDNKIELPATWEEAKEHWREQIRALLQAHLDGDCRITLDKPETYQQVWLPLNRFNEADSLREWLITHANQQQEAQV